jgi:predicted metal-dependent HD superfamily phosphohydrolase
MMTLKEEYFLLLVSYTSDENLITNYWLEIENAYCNPNRHYHTLGHLENLLTQLSVLKKEFVLYDSILFSLYYHDIIYDVFKNNNEVASAEFALQRMLQLLVPEKFIEACEACILATQTHQKSTSTDINYFLDADISILGSDEETYLQYANNVRLEYAAYPDEVYRPGRRQVLLHFLTQQQIFKTEYFKKLYEQQARINLSNELAQYA